MTDAVPSPVQAEARHPPAALLVTLAVATGALVANLYYAQPLVGAIGPAIGISPDLAGSVVSVIQVSYGLGLFFLVSLADLVESKRLVLTLLVLTGLGLAGTAMAGSAPVFFGTSMLVGVCSAAAQILLPFTAHLVPVERRGRVVGNVMAGVLTGIMLARPVSLFVSAAFGWRAIFWASTVLMVAIFVALARMMPRHKPQSGLHYGQILASMAGLARARPAVLWRAAYQALMFGAFNLFWTAVPLMLASRFGLNEREIGLFALAGAGGAFAAPFAGRLADRGLGTRATAVAMATLALCFAATIWAAQWHMLVLIAILAIAIDAAVQTNQVVSQRIIFAVPAEIRGRVNAVFMTVSFLGGALGSMLSTITLHHGGWVLTATAGAAMGVINLVLLAVEMANRRRSGPAGSPPSSP